MLIVLLPEGAVAGTTITFNDGSVLVIPPRAQDQLQDQNVQGTVMCRGK